MRPPSFLSRVFGTQLALPLFRQAPPVTPTRPLQRVSPVRTGAEPPPLHADLRARLEGAAGRPVSVTVHDNRSTMISFRHRDDRLHLRVHRMFLHADATVVRALVDFTGRRGQRRSAGPILDAYIKAHQEEIRPSRFSRCEPRGRFHDLEATYRSLNSRFFEGTIDAVIGWGRPPRGRRRRHTIKMGLYFHEQRVIRIHVALDRPEVPDYVLGVVVYHEMLHQACPPERTPQGRQRIHTRAFRSREKLHPDHERALAWEKKNLKILLGPIWNDD